MKKANTTRGTKASFETLERRQLMSAISFNGGTLVFKGDAWSSNQLTISVDNDGATLKANLNGVVKRFDLAAVERLHVVGGDSADRIQIDPKLDRTAFIRTGGGNDVVRGGGGSDTVLAGNGRDKVYGNGGDDLI